MPPTPASSSAARNASLVALERIARLVAEISERAASDAPGQLMVLEQIGRRLDEPLHVAVAGRVNAGKSTLVNALLGQRVAPTDARECTRVVTTFRYGPIERVTVLTRAGARVNRRLDADGLVPIDLGVPSPAVASVEVELSLERLRAFSLADTPGLASADGSISQVTEDLLGLDEDSQQVIARAEAVLFVMNQTVRQSDLDVIRGFRAMARSTSDPVATLAVLNKADLLDGSDPMATAAGIASRHAAELRGEVATVVAYSGLLAETARGGMFTEADAAVLDEIGRLDPARQERMLLSASSFCRGGTAAGEPGRRRLWGLLRESGLRMALEMDPSEPAGAASIRRHLERRSGHDVVERHLAEVFVANAPALKATAALGDLEAIAWQAGGAWGERVRDRIEALRLEPDLHVLHELSVLRQVRRGELDLPEDLLGELQAIVAGSDLPPGGLARWRSFANTEIAPSAAHAARVMVRSFELAADPRSTR